MNIRPLMAGAAVAAMLAMSSTARAELFLIDLFGNNPSATTMQFDIPTVDQNLVATPVPASGLLGFPSLITQNGNGIGVNTGLLDFNNQVDNISLQEGIQFTLTPGSIGNFRLAAIEFANVDEGVTISIPRFLRPPLIIQIVDADEFNLNVGGDQPLSDVNIPCGVANASVNGGQTCWVTFLDVSSLGIAGITNPLGLNQLFSDTFNIMTTEGEHNDDWRIRRIVWELNPVPEPATMTLFGLGLLGLGLARRRKAG